MASAAKVLSDLDADSLRMIVACAANERPTPRAVCKEWQGMVDEMLDERQREMCTMLEACRFRVVRSARLPIHWLLAYTYPAAQPSPTLYRCARCYGRVHELGACETCLEVAKKARRVQRARRTLVRCWRSLAQMFGPSEDAMPDQRRWRLSRDEVGGDGGGS